MAVKDLQLKALKPKDKPYYFIQKSSSVGNGTLGFRVLPTGAIDAYFIYYPSPTSRRLKKIGRYGKGIGEMPLQQIFNEYNTLSTAYQSGIDVKQAVKQREISEKLNQQALSDAELKRRTQGSFKQLIELYLINLNTNKSQHHYVATKKAFNNLGNFDTLIKASDITKADILAIINPIMARGALVMANRMYAYLSAMFKWGIEFDDTHHAESQGVRFFLESNPVATVKKPHKNETPTDRYLIEPEVRDFMNALGKSGIAQHRANILRLMLFTGARLEAVSTLMWQNVDLDNRLITISPSHSKNGLTWVIPLGSLAYEILSNTPRIHNEFVFGKIRLDYFSKAVTRLCDQFGIKQFSPKDLRTTFKTLAGKAGISKDIRDRIQNHALTDVSAKHYDRYEYLKEKQAAMQVWDDFLINILSGEK